MERGEIEELLRAVREAREAGRQAALATVVRVQGSAYRREGARMLVRDDGVLACMLSGGCLEPAVADVAARVLRSGRPELQRYDLEEDVVWGLGLGCGGTVDVYIEPLAGDPLLSRWLELLGRGEAGVLATLLDGSGNRMLVESQGGVTGTTRSPDLDARVRAAAADLLAESYPRAGTRRFAGNGSDEDASDVFLDVASPPLELVVFGAGHDAIPLVAQARALGWPVTVVDARTAFLTAQRFPGARLIVAPPASFASGVRLDRRSHVLVMNHHLDRDRETLAFALGSRAPWIGILGPRSRYRKLVDALAADGVVVSQADAGRIRNPIGLDIGAESPEEVALSILGALIAERRGFRGGSLDGVSGRIHDPVRQA
jgi:xanthine/CO dehydrogenase XdhC/CoxF family maturation factor